MKKLILLSCFAASMLLTSCGAFKSYMASYDIGLSSVESPADAKKQFGETKVVNFTVYDKKSDYENGTMNFKDYMDGDNITLKKGAFVIILCEGKDKGITGLDLEVK